MGFLRSDFLPYQTRQFIGIEKTQIQCNQISLSSNSFVQTFNRSNTTQFSLVQRWTQFNNLKMNRQVEESTKILMIYSYCISINFLKEVFFKLGVKCMLTNDLQKASIIIGLKQHLYQNDTLQKFATRNNIPVYALNQVNFYKLTKLTKIMLT